MKLTDFVADVPDDVWAVFEPLLPPVVWQGVGRKPKSNRECLHALLYVLIAGIGWEFLPKGFPSSKTVRRRLKRWLVALGKAGRARWMRKRPSVRGVAMNPVDHPLGGGEGKSSGGRHPTSPWGKKEGRTRKKGKASDKFIVRRRGKGRG